MPTPEQRLQTVDNAIREISHIATLPEITVKIVELVENPKSTAQDLHKVISQDPALCSRILKVVNSSFYGLPGQIGSINRAIVMLGLNAVKNIAIAASLVKLFRGGDLGKGFSAKQIWDHSSLTAGCCKLISDQLKLGLNDEAYLAGLVHDIGIVVEMQFDRNKLIEALQKTSCDSAGAPANDLLTIEDAVFGANHQDFGMALCEKWKFPKNFSYVTGFHHRPLDLAFENRTLTCVVYLADRLAAEFPTPFRADLHSLDIDAGVLDQLKITSDRLKSIRDAMHNIAKAPMDAAA
ncbi:MAG: HDOD domain-containing protein [Phycisphaeraceae bacterium]|nr:HDOD domain-containing protein [Phycisphaeraceae bacterium]